jgi:hypothetical protein
LVSFARRVIRRILSSIGAHSILLRWRAWEDLHFGEPELLLKYLVDPDRIALDIGPAEGVYLFHLKRLALHCVAFEPNPKSFEQSQRAISGIEIYQGPLHVLKSGCRWCDCSPSMVRRR